MKGIGPAVALALAAAITAPAAGQTATYETSDDIRRVLVPPVDREHMPALVITGATLLDGRGGAPVADAVIVMRGDRIFAAGPAASTPVPADVARTVDARGLYVMPGLIDLHLHVTSQRGDDFGRYPDSDAAAAIRATVLAASAIKAGITAIRDPATIGDVALRMKEAVQRGIVVGPRILWSGAMIATTGGHGDEITGTATGRFKPDVPNSRTVTANGPWEWRQAVRSQVRRQVDWVKVSAPFEREEIAAAVDEAHREGLRVAIDSFGEYSEWAVAAGVDSLEHTLDMSDATVTLMAKHKTGFVPTLTAFRNLLTRGYPPAGIPAGAFYYTFSRRYPIDFQANLRHVRDAYKAGVRIGVGTDIPFENERLYPASYHEELGYLREAGLSNKDVLASATRIGADILGMGDKLGTIEAGKIADLIVLGGNPEQDLSALKDVRYVVAGGKVAVSPD